MSIKLRYHHDRRNRLLTKWKAIASEYEEGTSVIELAKKYGYSRQRIYQIFDILDQRQFKTSS
jgi:Mor family transcriptional regulator